MKQLLCAPSCFLIWPPIMWHCVCYWASKLCHLNCVCVCVHVFWAGCSSYKKTTNFECECVFCVWFYDIGYVTRLKHIVSLWFIVKFQRLWNIIHMLDIYSESANIHRNTFIISRVFPQKSAIHLLNEIYLHYLYTEMCVFYLVLHNLGNKHTKWPRKKG